jgi:hypothetical protein
MSDHTNNSSHTITLKKAKENREKFLQVDVPIWDKLSPYALKVYGQLRKRVDFQLEHSETEITVEALAIASGISIRKTYSVLNELEKEHFIIQRLNQYHCQYGKTNSFDIAQTYGFFKPVEIKDETEEQQAPVQKLNTPAQYAVPPAPGAVPPAQYAYSYNVLDSFSDSSYMCGEKQVFTQHTIKKLKKEKAEQNAIQCEEAQSIFQAKFEGRQVTIEELFESCREHYDQKSTWASKDKFIKWLKRERPENFPKIGANEDKNSKWAKASPEECRNRAYVLEEIRKEKELDGYVSKLFKEQPELRTKYA